MEERSLGVLRSLGLGALDLDRTVGKVSGGEATLLAVSAALLKAPSVLLLDEPTNNLDTEARDLLTAALARRQGATLVVTHDRQLLGAVERIGELRERDERTSELRWFGGNIAAFDEAIAAERDTARQTLANAKSVAQKEHRDLRTRVEGDGKRRQRAAKARANAEVTSGRRQGEAGSGGKDGGTSLEGSRGTARGRNRGAC